MGRPVTVTCAPKDIADEIVLWISGGRFLSEYCRLDGKPSRVTVYNWFEKDPEFAERVARAREMGADVLAESVLQIADAVPDYENTAHGSKVDSGYVSWQKNRVWARMQMIAKLNPKKYGEKSSVELTGADGGPVKVEDTQRSARIAQLLATAKTRKLEEEDFGDLA